MQEHRARSHHCCHVLTDRRGVKPSQGVTLTDLKSDLTPEPQSSAVRRGAPPRSSCPPGESSGPSGTGSPRPRRCLLPAPSRPNTLTDMIIHDRSLHDTHSHAPPGPQHSDSTFTDILVKEKAPERTCPTVTAGAASVSVSLTHSSRPQRDKLTCV